MGATVLPSLESRHNIDDGQRAAFARGGHALVRALATTEEVAAYRPHLEAAAARLNREQRPIDERDTYGQAFLQCCNLWQHDATAARFVCAQRFANVAADLLGVERVRLYHDQALIKEAGGGHTPWHQDQFYWPLDTEQTITMWMPLTDLDERVGSMTFATGSHRLGDLRGHAISDKSEAAFEAMVRERDIPEHTYGALRAGDATFHAGWTLHRAGRNPTDAVRPVMTVIYFADGARATEPESIYQKFDLAVWLPGVQPGDLAASALNPALGD